jgi:ABC-type transport system involved in multi-copper enzyme maturation permease subunit
MKSPEAIYTLRWLIRDTFRQALASGIFWLMLLVTLMCTAVCLSVTVVGDAPLGFQGEEGLEALSRDDIRKAREMVASLVGTCAGRSQGIPAVPHLLFSDRYKAVAIAIRDKVPIVQGEMSFGFGAFPAIEINRGRDAAVKTLQFQLAGWVADTFGLLLALVWTAGFLPTFLEPSAVTVLLAKPVPRWSLLVGKVLGVIIFVAFQVALFIGLTWLALGLRTGVWNARYWLCLPLLLLNFSIFYAFSAMLAVATRSTVACVFGSIFFWLVCWLMNFGRHSVALLTDLSFGTFARGIIETGYWILPKPLDFHFVLMQAIGADTDYVDVLNLAKLTEVGAWMPGLAVLTSAIMGLILLAGAAYEFVTKDY